MSDSLVRADSLGDRLARTLRDRIVRGEITPGTHLVEDTVAESFDVSRGPVRDALRMLRLENLVEPQRRGVHVVGLSTTDVRELYAIRQAIEGLAVTTAIGLGEHRSGAGMAQALRGMADTATPTHAAKFAEYDLLFHRGIYEASGNRRLLTMWLQIEPLFASMLAVTNSEDEDLSPVVTAHEKLRDAIVAGDNAEATALLTSHLEGSEKRMLSALQRIWANSVS
ncbi:GntR family transcriptional regulator of gluconate operon [Prauserella rugosa]|uniref:GntR family transcriptional regulator of gluconate operon n=1 Tax=Prauserella rugosa TaxID=43354 RepID=A0A660CJK7_9PSEU|nr:GntR family transcriptional regulator of gluconate operon [Prauserella rugosa]